MINLGERVKIKLSRFQYMFLILSNFIIVLILIIDLLHLSSIYEFDLPYLTLVNLVVLIVAYFSYRIKKRVRLEMLKIKERNKGN